MTVADRGASSGGEIALGLAAFLSPIGYHDEMASRFWKLLLRLVLVVAAYAAVFAVFWHYPLPDRLWALLPGTLLASLLVLIRKDQITGVLLIGFTTLVGTTLGFAVGGPSTNSGEDRPWHEIGAAMIGTILGGAVAIINEERWRNRKKPGHAN
jgi:steroid 5-alpha reductase family enzyme